MPQSQLWILKEIKTLNPSGKYVFEQHGERIRTCLFDDRIRRICSKLEIKEKSLNKIKRLNATLLIDKRVDDSLIIAQWDIQILRQRKITIIKIEKICNRNP